MASSVPARRGSALPSARSVWSGFARRRLSLSHARGRFGNLRIEFSIEENPAFWSCLAYQGEGNGAIKIGAAAVLTAQAAKPGVLSWPGSAFDHL